MSRSLARSPQLQQAQLLTSKVAHSVLFYVVYRHIILAGYRHMRARGVIGSVQEIIDAGKDFVIGLLLQLPSSKQKIATELGAARDGIEEKLVPRKLPEGSTYVNALPKKGKTPDWLNEEMERLLSMEKNDVQEGRVSGAVYHGGSDVNQVIMDAVSKFIVSNPLHPDVFPGVRKMESEVVSMCLALFNNPNGAGTTTSGGTESILMSVKTHRDWARKTKGITNPEMVIPASAHAAFWKAADYFKVKMHVIPVDEVSRKANVKRMRRAINANTIMLVGSAPNFPDGAVDPITDLAGLAKKYKIGLHVDCCLGSFLMPFLKRTDPSLPNFDFSVDGVTAISCDIHKYGFCPKGSSVIMYKNKELRRHQYYIQPDWAGGVYASPSMAGSRPGSIIAGAYAVMMHMGEDGYARTCDKIISAARVLKSRLQEDFAEDLYVLGDPQVSVVAFSSKTLNIYEIGDRMSKRGWHLNALANPSAIHMAVTLLSANAIDKLLEDLRTVINQVKSEPPSKDGTMVALYGLGQTSVGKPVVPLLAEMFIDTLYMTRPGVVEEESE